jgi:hypothetical protein
MKNDVLCVHCHKPIDESNGGQLKSSYPPVEVFVHHPCKNAWLEAHSGSSFQGLKPQE